MEDEFNSFDFVINDEGEVMLLLYEREDEPKDSKVIVNYNESSISLYRNEDDQIELMEIEEDIMQALKKQAEILVCELSIEDVEDDTTIVHSYSAEIIKNN